ncbi:hypothetical protein ACIHIX_25260 [Streptomyces sp. NPDC051913]
MPDDGLRPPARWQGGGDDKQAEEGDGQQPDGTESMTAAAGIGAWL